MYRMFAVIAAVAIVAVLGVMAYNAGVAHGIAQSGKIIAPAGAPYPHPGWHPWGFGFFFAPFLFLFVFFMFLGALRAAVWGGRGHWHHMGCGYRGLDEWHRNAHETWNQPTGGAAPQR